MKVECPLCDGTRSKVYDHDRRVGNVRLRKCLECGARWATEERFLRLVQDSTDDLGTGTRYWVKGARDT